MLKQPNSAQYDSLVEAKDSRKRQKKFLFDDYQQNQQVIYNYLKYNRNITIKFF